MNSQPDCRVPSTESDRPPPSQRQVVRFIVLCLFTVGIVLVDMMLLEEAYEAIHQHGYMFYLQQTWKRVNHRAAYGALPLGLICIVTVWMDRHIILKPIMASNHTTTIAYHILVG